MSQSTDETLMARALELAERGRGAVEPNPMVGCVIVRDGQIIGEGWHQRFGEGHAEVNALASAGDDSKGATAFVTLEPCCHTGKTPPCSQALIDAGISQVVVAQTDPFEQVSGGGIEHLRQAGVRVSVGVLEQAAKRLNAPYLKLVLKKKPWVIAKWAMTLDGKIATASGDSQWISNEQSREIVHQIRGRVDAVIVGKGTAEADDPRLTARPPGARNATRIVFDSKATLSPESNLAKTANESPVMIVAGSAAAPDQTTKLETCGCEVVVCDGKTKVEQINQLLCVLGARQMTNVLLEGGSELMGQFFDARQIDEAHVFIAPKIAGGGQALTPVAGKGVELMSQALMLNSPQLKNLDGDVYLSGRLS